MAYVGIRLRELRVARGLTQDQLAKKAGIARTDVNRIERNNLSVGQARLERLAGALEVSRLELQPDAEPDAQGTVLLDRQAALEEDLSRLKGQVVRLARQVAALERRDRPAAPKTGRVGR